MGSEEILIVGVPLAAFIVSVVIAHLLGRARNGMVLGTLGLIWTVVTGATAVAMGQASGWDGIPYLLGLVFLCAPVGAGLGIGGLVGWVRSRKELHA